MNQQGGYKFFNLHTGKRITRRKWTALPMPHDVISHVNKIGQSQGQPSLLTFQDCHGNPIGEDDPDFSTPDEITGVPNTESPRTLITGVKFDYTKHCKLPFGAYAQVH